MPSGTERAAAGDPRRERPAAEEPRREHSPADDPLRALEERIEQASRAAERLFSEAASQAARRMKPPPAGWQAPEPGASGDRDDPVLALVATLRGLVPEDLRRRLAEAIRELLLAVRALIDWYLEHVDRSPGEPPEIQDIPIA